MTKGKILPFYVYDRQLAVINVVGSFCAYNALIKF